MSPVPRWWFHECGQIIVSHPLKVLILAASLGGSAFEVNPVSLPANVSKGIVTSHLQATSLDWEQLTWECTWLMISQLSRVWRHLQDAGVQLHALLPAVLHDETFINDAREAESSLTPRLAQQERSWEVSRMLHRHSQTTLADMCLCILPGLIWNSELRKGQ